MGGRRGARKEEEGGRGGKEGEEEEGGPKEGGAWRGRVNLSDVSQLARAQGGGKPEVRGDADEGPGVVEAQLEQLTPL
eukprot:474986-Hanusia_phi.AAC.1